MHIYIYTYVQSCIVLHCVAVCCTVLYCVALSYDVCAPIQRAVLSLSFSCYPSDHFCRSAPATPTVLPCRALRCIVLHCVAL